MKKLVYDYKSTKEEELHPNKDMNVFSSEFIYLTIRNHFLAFLGSMLIIIYLEFNGFYFGYIGDVLNVLTIVYFSFPFFYFILNVINFPNLKAKFTYRLLYLIFLNIVALLLLFTFGFSDTEEMTSILLLWGFLFVSFLFLSKAFGFGPIDKKNSILLKSENQNEKHVVSYTRELVIKSIFNKKEIGKTIAIFYTLLGSFLLLIFSKAYTSNFEFFMETEVATLFFLLSSISILAAFVYATIQTIIDSSENKLFLKTTFKYRLLFYIIISILIIFVLFWLNSILEGYYFEAGRFFNFVYFMDWVIFFWSVPGLGILIFYWRKLLHKREVETYDQLLASPLALNLTKYYLLTRLSQIKNVLDSTDPLDFDMKFKKTIEKKLTRLKESCKSNGIKIKSLKGLKNYVLHVASPLRETLREAIGRNYTEIYLSDNISSEDRVVNYDEIWRKINKAFLQWESNSPKEK